MHPATPPTNAQLGAAIRRLRTEAELSIEALADKAGMHWTYLSGIERGNYNPSWTKLGGLAAGLNIPVSAIVDAAEAEAAASNSPTVSST